MVDTVDVILPTFNPNLTLLERAVDSILSQSFSDWTLYIVQDGGEPSLSDFIQRINDRRIVFHCLPHAGKAVALNFALRQGTGKYIAYLDDDDLWYPNHLEVALGPMKDEGVRFVHTDAYEIFVQKERERHLEISRNILHRGGLSDVLLWYVSHINTVHERILLEKAGYYDETRKVFIDWDMLLRLSRHAKPYHVQIVTCEHFIYVTEENKQTNTISKIHATDPDYSKRMHEEMFKRALELLSPDDFVRLVWELFSKTNQLADHAVSQKSIQGSSSTASAVQQFLKGRSFLKLCKQWLRKN
jgi:glycosyltransferase involved in cell wall biosynthesis